MSLGMQRFVAGVTVVAVFGIGYQTWVGSKNDSEYSRGLEEKVSEYMVEESPGLRNDLEVVIENPETYPLESSGLGDVSMNPPEVEEIERRSINRVPRPAVDGDVSVERIGPDEYDSHVKPEREELQAHGGIDYAETVPSGVTIYCGQDSNRESFETGVPFKFGGRFGNGQTVRGIIGLISSKDNYLLVLDDEAITFLENGRREDWGYAVDFRQFDADGNVREGSFGYREGPRFFGGRFMGPVQVGKVGYVSIRDYLGIMVDSYMVSASGEDQFQIDDKNVFELDTGSN